MKLCKSCTKRYWEKLPTYILVSLTILFAFAVTIENFKQNEWLTPVYSMGVSNGEPYCIYCIEFYSKLVEPKKDGEIMYFSEKNNFTVSHRFSDKSKKYFIAYATLPNGHKQYELFKEENYRGTQIFSWNVYTTESFLESCIHEIKDIPREDIEAYFYTCLSWNDVKEDLDNE